MARPTATRMGGKTVNGVASKAGTRQLCTLKALGVVQALVLGAFAVAIRYQKKAAENPSSVVRVLTDDTLSQFVADLPDGALVNFHSPTCHHCQALEPEFEAAARELAAASGTPLASASVAAAPQAMARYGVQRYPTMLWFRKGDAVLELPPRVRTAAKIVKYVTWAGQPAVVPFETRDELEEALPELRSALYLGAPPVIVGFDDHGVSEALEAAAERSRGKTVFALAGGRRMGDPALRAYAWDAADDRDFEGKVSAEAVHAWVSALVVRKPALVANATR